jgi:hypothetical protein
MDDPANDRELLYAIDLHRMFPEGLVPLRYPIIFSLFLLISYRLQAYPWNTIN